MSKPIKALLKLQIPGGGATPAPPVGSALGQYGVNIMDFVQAFNNDTASRPVSYTHLTLPTNREV